MTDPVVGADAVRWFRFRRHQLDRDPVKAGNGGDADLLDYGVQDTGPDGAAWALAIRGADPPVEDLVYAWTIRFYGPARIRDAAEFLDAPQADVERHWPDDVVEVRLNGEGAPSSGGRAQRRYLLAEDMEAVAAGRRGAADAAPAVRLLGPYDPFLQLRDRELLVPDPERRKALWPVIGRPGAVVARGELLGLWRPRTTGKRLRLTVEPWKRLTKPERTALEEQAERLAAHRDVTLAGLAFD